MSRATIQFTQLEQLLQEVAPDDTLRVHVLEQTRTTSSHGLTRKEISIGLCVRTATGAGDILAWYCQIDRLDLYLPSPADGRSPEKARYEAAWEQVKTMQAALIAVLQAQGYATTAHGVIELQVQALIRGTTELVVLPATSTDV
jgi:hypothetical protein